MRVDQNLKKEHTEIKYKKENNINNNGKSVDGEIDKDNVIDVNNLENKENESSDKDIKNNSLIKEKEKESDGKENDINKTSDSLVYDNSGEKDEKYNFDISFTWKSKCF